MKKLDIGALYGIKAIDFVLRSINEKAGTNYSAVDLGRGMIAINSIQPATLESPFKIREIWRGHVDNAVPYFLLVYESL